MNKQDVAIKIQYPGVAKGIQSDIENLVGIMKVQSNMFQTTLLSHREHKLYCLNKYYLLQVWNIFPEGIFIDNLVEVAKRELAWEVDYIREAECTRKYKELMAPYPDYYVPTVIGILNKKLKKKKKITR